MRRIKRFLGIVILLTTLLFTMLYFFQEKLIFLPTKLAQDYQYTFQEPFEEVFLEAEDGARLNALHFKRNNPKGLILYFHGNAGDLSRWGQITTFFVHKGYDVLVMDYRTYGKSTGELNEKKLYEDAMAFYKLALEQYQESDIIVYGRSLGTTFATHVAANHRPGQLILETPFYSLEEVAKNRFSWLPITLLLQYRFRTHLYINQVDCPITIFHGTEDSVVPFEHGKKLFDSIGKSSKTFVRIDGGEHNDLIDFPKYHQAVDHALSFK